MTNFGETLIKLIKQDSRFIDENNEIIRSEVVNSALKADKQLITLFLTNKDVKEKFFSEIKGYWVFETNKFIDYIQDKNFLNDSYTKYANKIGLAIGDKLLKERSETALIFPFKDCILEGGQTKQEERRKEIFFNEILAQDEIDRLFDKKVLTNFKKYTTKGEEQVKDFKRNKKGMITDNLIIKGNNLLAMHSIKDQFVGKIKLIYIDPPYNTGNDSFGYNDRFNHSTWLTFMKNRLEIARDLLNDEGVIFVQCDDNEEAYLKVLMDEIFQRSNHLITISVSRSSAAGHKTVNPSPINVVDYILMYAKEKSKFDYKRDKAYIKSDYDEMYSLYVENKDDNPDKWKISKVEEVVAKKLGYKNVKEAKKQSNFKKAVADFALENAKNIFEYTGINYSGVSKETQTTFDKSKANPDKIFYIKRDKEDDIYLKDGRRMTFYNNKARKIDGELTHSKILTNFWDDISWNGIADEGGVRLNKGKKPEKLLKRIIEISTDIGDIVLDYHMGSGTTCAVAHKMGRQYIGIEQLEYEENGSVIRLRNVIGKEKSNGRLSSIIVDYDESGISKVANWKGGGEFIYCELAKYNENFVEKINKAETMATLLKIWEEMKERSFLNYNIEIKEQDKNIDEFKKFSITRQKETLLLMLNKNQLYVNLSDIDDSNFRINKEDKELNKKFYSKGGTL